MHEEVSRVVDLAGRQAAKLEGPTFVEMTTTVRRRGARVPEQIEASNT
jgi:hypothetical protein